ncbi:MAG: GHMP kinase [Armatimonadetes bacterium]|nr:GHMP kinase [Armatimonadota bacterium]
MIITQTPLRISFAGGGTDFRGFYKKEYGAVVSTAIDKYVYVIVKERFDDLIRVGYTRTEMVERVDEIQHELVRESMRLVGIKNGIEVSTMADIPSEGSGLGSSSTVTVGLLNALYAHKGEAVTAEQLAQEACKIEIEVLGKPIGKQDQYIAAYGGLRHFKFFGNEDVDSTNIAIDEGARQRLCESLLLFYTGVTRKSSSVLTEQKGNIDRKMTLLVEMRDQADELARLLKLGAIASLGQTLREGWERKKQLASGISNPQIDELYDLAMSAGAIGGKVTGAGGGGFFLVCSPPENRAAVRKKLSHLRELPVNLSRDGSKVIFNVRR